MITLFYLSLIEANEGSLRLLDYCIFFGNDESDSLKLTYVIVIAFVRI